MAVIAIITARDMRGMFARCGSAVMTRSAGTQDLSMVNGIRRRKYVGVVTIFADVGRLNMSRTFTDRIDAVVTAGTIIGDTEVIEIRRTPSYCRVAVITGVTARDMGWMFTCGDIAVMACVTGTDDLRVVNGKDWRKYVGVMAVLANVAGLNMCKIFTDSVDAIVTVDTVTGYVDVIEVCREPADG